MPPRFRFLSRGKLVAAAAGAVIFGSVSVSAQEIEWSSGELSMFRSAEGKQGLERVEWNFNNARRTTVVPAIYDLIVRPEASNDTRYVVMKGGKYGLVDDKGKLLLDVTYDYIERCQYGTAHIVKGTLGGLADCETGAIILSPEYQDIHGFFGTPLTTAVKDGKYGAVNRSGRVVVPFEHFYARSMGRYTSTYASEKGPSATYDGEGKLWHSRSVVIEQDYGDVMVMRGSTGKVGLVNPAKETVLEDAYEGVTCDEQLMCVFGGNGSNGLFDARTRKIVLPVQPGHMMKLGNLWAGGARKGSGEGAGVTLYDRSGKPMFGQVFDATGPASNGLISVKKAGGLWGLIDQSGKMVVPFEILNSDGPGPALYFHSGGRIEASKASGTGLVDSTGRVLIPFRYGTWLDDQPSRLGLSSNNAGSDFTASIVTVVHDRGVPEPHPAGLLKGDGSWIIPPGRYGSLETALHMGKQQLIVTGKGRWNDLGNKGLYDIGAGREILPPIYKSVTIAAGYVSATRADARTGYVMPGGSAPIFLPTLDVARVLPDRNLLMTMAAGSEFAGTARGLATLDGKEILPVQQALSPAFDVLEKRYTEYWPLSAFWVIKGNKLGVVDFSGRTIIPARYDAEEFVKGSWAATEQSGLLENGMYSVRLQGESVLLDGAGKEIARGKDLGLTGVSRIRKVNIGARDVLVGEQYAPGGASSTDKPTSYTMLIDGKLYTDINEPTPTDSPWINFAGGFLVAKRGGKFGFLDRNGREAIPFIYDEVTPFNATFAIVRSGQKWTIINREGRDAAFYHLGLARLSKQPMAADK